MLVKHFILYQEYKEVKQMVSTCFSCSSAEYLKIVQFQNDMNYSSVSKAVRVLIQKGIAHDQEFKDE